MPRKHPKTRKYRGPVRPHKHRRQLGDGKKKPAPTAIDNLHARRRG